MHLGAQILGDMGHGTRGGRIYLRAELGARPRRPRLRAPRDARVRRPHISRHAHLEKCVSVRRLCIKVCMFEIYTKSTYLEPYCLKLFRKKYET